MALFWQSVATRRKMKEKGDKTKTDRYVPEQVFIIILIIVNSIVKKVLLDQTKWINNTKKQAFNLLVMAFL